MDLRGAPALEYIRERLGEPPTRTSTPTAMHSAWVTWGAAAAPSEGRHARRPPSAARAASAPTTPIAIHPIATAYVRAFEEEADTTPEDRSESAPHHDATDVPARDDDDIPTSIDAVIELLAEAGVMPERPRALLEAAAEDPRATKVPLLKRLMEFVLRHDETAYLTRSRELGFLANTLLAGSSVQSRPFTPPEASDAAACICNLGLDCWPVRWPGATSQGASSRRELDTAMPPNPFLVDHDLVTAFEVGWSVLYQDVSLFVRRESPPSAESGAKKGRHWCGPNSLLTRGIGPSVDWNSIFQRSSDSGRRVHPSSRT